MAAFLDICMPIDRAATIAGAGRYALQQVPLSAMPLSERTRLGETALLFGSRLTSGQGVVLIWTEPPSRCEIRLTNIRIEVVERQFEAALDRLKASGGFEALDVPPSQFPSLQAGESPDYRLRRAVIFAPRLSGSGRVFGLALRATPPGEPDPHVTLAAQVAAQGK